MQTDRLLFRLASGLTIRGGFVKGAYDGDYPDEPSHWFIWINANQAFTQGTQLRLYSDGRKEVILIHDDGTEDVIST